MALLASGSAFATEFNLVAVTFPDGKTIDLPFARTNATPNAAKFEAAVKFSEGQARIEVSFKKMEPAILFGGDVSSYVVWAVTRDGAVENLGELIVLESNASGSGKYQTGQEGVRSHDHRRAVLPRRQAERVRDRDVGARPNPEKAPSTTFAFTRLPHGHREGRHEHDRGPHVQGQEARRARAGRARHGRSPRGPARPPSTRTP